MKAKTNIDPETGIRYGLISGHSIHPEVWDDLTICRGKDVRFESAKEDLASDLLALLEPYGIRKEAVADIIEHAVGALGEDWYDDEPVYEGTRDGVSYRTTWIGGAPCLWVFSSPHTGGYRMCSPCAPNAGNLNSPDEEGVTAYTVPEDWLAEDAA